MTIMKVSLLTGCIVIICASHTYAAASCDITINSTVPGYFSSPGYPTENYPNNADWCVLVTAPSTGYDVRLTIKDFHMEESALCTLDSLSFYDASNDNAYIGTYCSTLISSQFQSKSILIRLISDGTYSGRGFNASYEFVEDNRWSSSDCGTQVVPLNPEADIVGGKPAQPGEWPWQATHLVYSAQDGWYFNCGASLLSPDWIITAAHCIYALNEPYFNTYLLGTTDIVSSMNGHQQFAEVEQIYIHPNYSQFAEDWDMALMKLTHPVVITDYVRPVCIPGVDMASLFDTGTLCTISGWGATSEGGDISTVLLEVELPIISKDYCGEIYGPDAITDNMICAGLPEGGKDSCQGDSGGPMVSKINDTWYLPGVVSWGSGCAREETPGVYARVTSFEDWIKPVFNGSTPQEYECSYGELQCLDGWCVDYEMKCNGNYNDGCSDGSDEMYCDGNLVVFDSFLYVKLTPSSIRDTDIVDNEEACAALCLSTTNYLCMAFDIEVDTMGQKSCGLAGSNYQVEKTDDLSILHFQIEKMPLPGSTLTSTSGRFATPLWLPISASNTQGSFYWIIGHMDFTVSVSLTFLAVRHGDQNCSDITHTNEVIVRAGIEGTPPVFQYCLDLIQLDIPVVVENTAIRVEFNTVDSTAYGFIAAYATEFSCNERHKEPGTISSPNYPNTYPDEVQCGYTIIAPPNMVVTLEMLAFDVEPIDWDYYDSISSYYFSDFMCPFDSLSIYDGPEAKNRDLIGEYCGTLEDIPGTFTSSGRHLFLKFKTDEAFSGVGFGGFHASFTFTEKIIDPANFIWVYVVGSIVGVLMIILIAYIVYVKCVKREDNKIDTDQGSFSDKATATAHTNEAYDQSYEPKE